MMGFRKLGEKLLSAGLTRRGRLGARMVGGDPTVTLPRYLLSSVGTQFETFSTLTDWNAVKYGCTLSSDTTNFRAGTASVKCVFTDSGYIAKDLSATPITFGTAPHVRFYVYLYGVLADFSNIKIMFGSAASGKYFQATYNIANNHQHTGWCMIDVYPSDWVNTGGDDWANPMIRFRFDVARPAGKTPTLSFDEVVTGLVGKPSLLLSFDDTLASTYTIAFAYMKPRNIRGVAYVNTDVIDTVGYMTTAQLLEMQAAGWDICNHTSPQTDLTTKATEAEVLALLETCRTGLVALGLNGGYHVAYPLGAVNELVANALINNGYLTGLTTNPVNKIFPSLGNDNNFVLGRFCVLNTTTVAALTGILDAAVAGNYPESILFHNLVSPADSLYKYTPANFYSFIDYVVSLHLPCFTISEFKALQLSSVNVPAV